MATVSYTMEVPKESKEVVDLIVAVVKKVKAKAPISEYASLIGELSSAVSGVDALPAEAASDGRDELAGYLVHCLLQELVPATPPAPAAA